MGGPFLCLHCAAPVETADTNVASDQALCRTCGRTMPFSALADDGALAAVDLSARRAAFASAATSSPASN